MAAVTQEKQYTPSLLSFFVYNPSFGPREGEVGANLKHVTCACLVFVLILHTFGLIQTKSGIAVSTADC